MFPTDSLEASQSVIVDDGEASLLCVGLVPTYPVRLKEQESHRLCQAGSRSDTRIKWQAGQRGFPLPSSQTELMKNTPETNNYVLISSFSVHFAEVNCLDSPFHLWSLMNQLEVHNLLHIFRDTI